MRHMKFNSCDSCNLCSFVFADKKREQRMFCRKKLDEQSQISKDIDDWLQEEQKNRVYNILLLGTGESGKTTFIKQMKIIHINGYDRK